MSLRLVVPVLSLCAATYCYSQAVDDACTRPMDLHTMVINIRANHAYQVNTRDTAKSDLLSVVHRANQQSSVNYVYIIPEPEATYVETQELADRLLGSIPRLHVAFLQPPRPNWDYFNCVAAKLSASTEILQRIPKPITPQR